MDLNNAITVAHDLGANWQNIISIQGFIRNDTGNALYPIAVISDAPDPDLAGYGVAAIDATNITLHRRTGSGWDSVAFSNTGYSRGNMIVWYSE